MNLNTEAEPYVGLRPYEIEDEGRFFGRQRESFELESLLFSSRLVVLYGPYGAGKSSLLRAGVLARLRPDQAHVLPAGSLPRASTLPAPALGDNPFTLALLSSWAPDRPVSAIRGLTVSDFLQGIPVALDRYGETPLPLVAVVDQFEELFRSGPDLDNYREAFLDQLAQAVEDIESLHLLLAMRQEVVGEFLPYEPRLSARNRRYLLVEPLEPAAALEAVTGPLPTSRSFAAGVAEALVDRLRTTTLTNEMGEQRTVVARTVEPASLQVICSALWRGLPDDVAVITTDHVQAHGDVEATLTYFCQRAVIDVAARESIPEREVWEWLEKTFITDLGTRNFAYEGVFSTGGNMPNAVARAFEEHRILRSEKRSQSVWFELLHDGLIEPIRSGRRLAEDLAAQAEQTGVEGTEGETSDAVRRVGPDRFLQMARTAQADGHLPLAEEYAKGAVQTSEDDSGALAQANSFLAELVLEQGRSETGARAEELYATAEDHYRRAAQLFDTRRDSEGVGRMLAALGRLFLERGRYADAVGALQSAVNRAWSNLRIRMDFARALLHSGQAQTAIGEYTVVLASAPDTVDALVGRGAISAEHGDPAAALRDIDKAIRLSPELAERPDVISARSRAHARLESHR